MNVFFPFLLHLRVHQLSPTHFHRVPFPTNLIVRASFHSFENPALSKFWSYIDSIALGVTTQQYCEENDVTRMRVDDIIEAAGKYINDLNALLPNDEIVLKSKKRKADLPPDDTGIDWFHEYKSGNLESFKINELKSYLKSFGEKVSGKKADLITRVKSHIEKSADPTTKSETDLK